MAKLERHMEALGQTFDKVSDLSTEIAKVHGFLAAVELPMESAKSREAREYAMLKVREALDQMQWYEATLLGEFQSLGGR
jgi:hypothetical protein